MRHFLTILLAAAMCFTASAGTGKTPAARESANVFVPIGKYIQIGNSEMLSAWFDDNLEISILGKTNDCSRKQAREIMSAFFEANAPQRFEIIHRSGEGRMKYAIGILSCGHSRFSVTICVKIGDDSNRIQMIRIENDF